MFEHDSCCNRLQCIGKCFIFLEFNLYLFKFFCLQFCLLVILLRTYTYLLLSFIFVCSFTFLFTFITCWNLLELVGAYWVLLEHDGSLLVCLFTQYSFRIKELIYCFGWFLFVFTSMSIPATIWQSIISFYS